MLEETIEFADYVAVHIYVEELERDVQTFLASGVELDVEIERAIAAADAAAEKRGVGRKLAVSVDEWGVWRGRDPNPPTLEDWPVERRIGESVYTAGDAVVTGALIVSLLNHADRVTCACQSLLVNAGAPIRAEADGVWRQSIYYPFQLAARHARGTALRATIEAPGIETRQVRARRRDRRGRNPRRGTGPARPLPGEPQCLGGGADERPPGVLAGPAGRGSARHRWG